MMKSVFKNFTMRFMPIAIVFAFANLFKDVTFDEAWNEMETYLLILLIPVVIYPIIGVLTKRNAEKISELRNQEVRIPPIEKSPMENTREVRFKVGLNELIMAFVLPLYLLNIMELSTYGKILVGTEIVILLVVMSGIKLQFSHIKNLKKQIEEEKL